MREEARVAVWVDSYLNVGVLEHVDGTVVGITRDTLVFPDTIPRVWPGILRRL